MKIKIDFVTNSSSTSYIVCIPSWFELSYEDEKVKKAAELYSDSTTPSIEIFQIMKKLFEELKYNYLLAQGNMDDDLYGFFSLCTFFNNSPYEITSFETGEGGGFIENIRVEQLNKIFVDVNEDQFYSTFKFFERIKHENKD